jgi:hypothetical protein
MHINDQTWLYILNRSRDGACMMDDLSEICQLVLTDPSCDIPDFTTPPWDEAVLVIPHHGVRNMWNAATIEKYSMKTHNIIYICEAEDGRGRNREQLMGKETMCCR